MDVRFGQVFYLKSRSHEKLNAKMAELGAKYTYFLGTTTETGDMFEGRVLTGKDARNVIRLFNIELIPGSSKAEHDQRIGQQLEAQFGEDLYNHLLRAISAYALLHEVTGNKFKTFNLDKTV